MKIAAATAVWFAALTVLPLMAQTVTSKEVYSHSPCSRLYRNTESKEDYQRSLECVSDHLSGDRTPDERAVLLRFKAQLEVELGNFRQAIRDIEASFETGALSDAEKAENYFFLGRLYLGIESPDYDKAIENLRKYIEAADTPDPDAYFYLGQAQALTGRYREALPNAEKAIELADDPQESHYRLLLFCHSELGNYKKIIPLAQKMVEQFGAKDEYLEPLADAQRALGRNEDAFLTDAQRYELDFLENEEEIIHLAEGYLARGNPHRAARILEKEMKAGRVKRTKKNLEKLGTMWFLAREYDDARANLTAAARLNHPKADSCFPDLSDCEPHFCHPYISEEAWECMKEDIRTRLKEGTLKTPCRGRVLLGHALLNEDKPDEALRQFERAAKSKVCAEEAGQWVEYLKHRKLMERETRKLHEGK